LFVNLKRDTRPWPEYDVRGAPAQGSYEVYELLEVRLRKRSQPKIAREEKIANAPEARIKGRRGTAGVGYR
jgi:hypothetical protein